MYIIQNCFYSLAAIAVGIILSSCSLEVHLINNESPLEASDSKTSSNELVPVSQQSNVTVAGYRVQSSVNFINGNLSVLTPKGYRVHSNVQSNLFETKSR